MTWKAYTGFFLETCRKHVNQGSKDIKQKTQELLTFYAIFVFSTAFITVG